MNVLLSIIFYLFMTSCSYAVLTAGYVPCVKNGIPDIQNCSMYDTGSPSGPGNVGIGSTHPQGALDVGNGSICLGHVCNSIWPSGGSSTVGSSILYGNGSGGFSNVTIGSNLTFTGGTLSATGGAGSGTVTSGTIGNEAVYTGSTTVASGIITDNGLSISVAGPLTATSFTGSGSSLTNIVNSTSNSDGSITVSNPTGAVTVSTNVGHTNTWTANQIFSGNVGIGSANPGKVLDVTGSVRLTGLIDTTNPTNGYILTTDNNGVATWQANAGASQWNTSGSYVYNTANNIGIGTSTALNGKLIIFGNEGIGTASPGMALDINGSVRLTNLINTGLNASEPIFTNSIKQMFSGTVSGNTTTVGTTNGSLTSGHCADFDANGNIQDAGVSCGSGSSQWTTNGSNIYYTTGNVGIGTSTALNSPLTVNGAVTALGSGTTILNNGNVGIGTITVNKLLTIGSTGQATVDSSGNVITTGTLQTSKITDNGTNVGIGTTLPSQALEVGNQKLDIMSNGNLGIGTINPQYQLQVEAPTATLQVFGTSSSSYGSIAVANNAGVSASLVSTGSGYAVPNTYGILTTAGYPFSFGNSNGSIFMTLDSNGNLGIGSTAPASQLTLSNGAAHAGQALCVTTAGRVGYCSSAASIVASGTCSCTAL